MAVCFALLTVMLWLCTRVADVIMLAVCLTSLFMHMVGVRSACPPHDACKVAGCTSWTLELCGSGLSMQLWLLSMHSGGPDSRHREVSVLCVCVKGA